MKQNFTCHLKTTILAIAFLLSGTMQTFSQQQLYIYNQNGNKISFETSINKVKLSLSSCEYFYLAVRNGTWPFGYYYPQRSSENAISITTTATTYNNLSEPCYDEYLTKDLQYYSQKIQDAN